VTGAFSYTGARIAERLLESGRSERTITFHPDRTHPLQGLVHALGYRFDNQIALTESTYANELQRHFVIPTVAP
jgi:hypothetical protein